MKPGLRIDYKQLRRINPEAARQAVLEYLNTNGRNIKEAGCAFGIHRAVVYDILRKEKEGSLSLQDPVGQDRSKAPKRQPKKTPQAIAEKNKTRLGPERLSRYLQRYEGISVPPGTIRHILRRNRETLTSPLPSPRVRKEKREFVDWYNAQPFEIVQMDVKFIRDQKALTKEQIIHLDAYQIPNYQWSALDVNSRFKLLDQWALLLPVLTGSRGMGHLLVAFPRGDRRDSLYRG